MFHVSKRDLGEQVTLIPKVPINATREECKFTPRVCFSPTVTQCVMGIVGWGMRDDITILGAFIALANSQWSPTVYYTNEELYEPDWVSDFHITHEEWALDPIEVYRVGYIDSIAMLKQRKVIIVDHPTFVSLEDQDILDHITPDDQHYLLKVLGDSV